MSKYYSRQNDLILDKLGLFYSANDYHNLDCILKILNGESRISLRIVDWFVTNYAKEKFTVYNLSNGKRVKIYADYRLKLKAYSKKRFDPFCRWERITIPYKNEQHIQTTIGQLNFFKWVIENEIMNYIEQNYSDIELDMNNRNSNSRNKSLENNNNKTRKKREELSISAVKSIKKENVKIEVVFD
jgi:hypothetical protein